MKKENIFGKIFKGGMLNTDKGKNSKKEAKSGKKQNKAAISTEK